MVAARWRQQRLWMIQSASIDLEQDRLDPHIQETMLECSEPTRISIAFNSLAKENGMDLLMRYETSYSRMHDRAMKALQRLQEQRSKAEPPKLAEPALPITSELPEPPKQNLRNEAKPPVTEPSVPNLPLVQEVSGSTPIPTNPEKSPIEPPLQL